VSGNSPTTLERHVNIGRLVLVLVPATELRHQFPEAFCVPPHGDLLLAPADSRPVSVNRDSERVIF
jgi:hypothetical protein